MQVKLAVIEYNIAIVSLKPSQFALEVFIDALQKISLQSERHYQAFILYANLT